MKQCQFKIQTNIYSDKRMLQIVFYILAAWLVIRLVYFTLKVRRSRLYQVVFQYPPCLRELPVVGSIYHMFSNSKDAMKTVIKLGNNTIKAGGISRIYGPNYIYIVLTEGPDSAAALTSCLNKDNVYTFLQVLSGNGSVFVPSASVAKTRRHAILPSFSSKMLASYFDQIREESEWLTDSLAQHAGKGPFEAEHYMSVYACRVILNTSGIGEHNKKEIDPFKISKDFYRCFELVFERWTRPWIHPDLLYRLSGNCREMEKLVSSFTSGADMVQEMRRSQLVNIAKTGAAVGDGQNEHGIFDSLIASKLNAKEVTEEIIVFVGATDEASLAIGFALMLLAQYPKIQDRVYEEIKEIFGESDRPLCRDDLIKMSYLDMVIKESMRLYPPVPILIRKADTEIELPSGRVIPAGASVAISVINLQRNPKHWGPDAEHFDPERFLPERLAGVPTNAFMPFSYGPRGCPGYKFGKYIVKIALCAILRKYKIVGNPAPGPVPDIPVKFEVALKTVSHVKIQIINRM